MTEEAKIRYEEDRSHYEIIRQIVQEEVSASMKPIETIMKWFISIALGVFAFMFLTQFLVYKELQTKESVVNVKAEIDKVNKTYLQKLSYYQIEVDEHRMMLEAVTNPDRATYVLAQINDNIASSLGFKYVSRGEE